MSPSSTIQENSKCKLIFQLSEYFENQGIKPFFPGKSNNLNNRSSTYFYS